MTDDSRLALRCAVLALRLNRSYTRIMLNRKHCRHFHNDTSLNAGITD